MGRNKISIFCHLHFWKTTSVLCQNFEGFERAVLVREIGKITYMPLIIGNDFIVVILSRVFWGPRGPSSRGRHLFCWGQTPRRHLSAYFVLKTLFLWRFVYYHTMSKTAAISLKQDDVFVHLETLKCCWCPWQPDLYKINNWNAKKKESHYFCVHGGWKVLILFCTWKKYPEKENPLWKTTDGKRKRKKKKKFSQEKRKPSTTRIRMARRQNAGWSWVYAKWLSIYEWFDIFISIDNND